MNPIDMPAGASRPTTASELDRTARSRTAELIDGDVVEKPTSEASSRAEGWIGARLTAFVMENPVALVYPASMGYRVFQQAFPDDPGRVRKPDVSVVLADRRRQLAAVDPVYLPIVPDLAVEVVSPNEVWSDLVEKVREYQAAGFPLVWIADPGFRTLMVHPTGGDPFMLTGDQTVTAESALPGFSCRVSDLFPPPMAAPATG